MKKMISVLAISMLAAVSSAFAGTVYMDGNDYASLPSCGGVVQTKISNYNTQLNLIFSNVSQCSNFDIVRANGGSVNYPNQKLQGQNQARYGSFTIPASLIEYGTNQLRISLKSNSGKHADTIVVTVRSTPSYPIPTPSKPASITMGSRDHASMRSCGGTVQTTVTNGQLNVVFRNVSQCSNFDIVKANGDRVDYPNLKLQGSNQNRYGSFTLPKSVIEFGLNTVRLSVKSNSGKHSELIVVNFLAF